MTDWELRERALERIEALEAQRAELLRAIENVRHADDLRLSRETAALDDALAALYEAERATQGDPDAD